MSTDFNLKSLWLPILLAALADWLFFDHPIGWTLGLFGFVVLLAVLTFPSSDGRRQRRWSILAAAGVGGLCLRCVYEPNALALAGLPLGLLTWALGRREGWAPDVRTWLRRWLDTLTRGWARSCIGLGRSLLRPLGSLMGNRARRMLRLWVLPVVLGCVFLALFAVANPLIGRALDSLWSSLTGWHIPHPSPGRILLWMVVATLAGTLLTHVTGIHRRTGDSPGPAHGAEPGGLIGAMLSPGIVRRSLILFNLLFAVQTLLDLIYLWGGAALPEDMTYAEYAHRGAYPLVAAALLAGGFTLAAFRPGSDGAGMRIERRLVYSWLGQTLLLVGSSAWRLWLYVGTYTLTRWRLAAAVWMLLVAFGLGWIILRIARRRSGAWLINANALTAAAVLYLCACAGSDAHIAWFNARHCAEIRGPGHPDLDVDYLRGLGLEALPALIWIERQAPGHPRAPKWREAIADASYPFASPSEWRGWTYRRAALRSAWSNWRNSRDEDDFGPPAPASEPASAHRR